MRLSPSCRARAVAGLVIALLLAVAGCTPSGPVTPLPDPPASTEAAPSVTAEPDDLAQRKAEAGIADCPTSDPDIPALPDGLPDLVLPCLGGGDAVRLAGLRGTPLVVNVWAQWCGPCRAEAPHLAKLSAELEGKVDFLGIDYNDPRPELAIDFAGAAGWHYPQVADEERSVQAGLGVPGPPMTVFVTADGRIAYRHPGVITSTEQLRSLIAEHLGVS